MSKSKEILKKTGQKVTKQRVEILDVLMEKVTPLSVQDISKKISNKKINTSTIYRNLTEMEKYGVVSRVIIDKNMSYFEFRKEKDDHHHHMVCKKCKKIEEIEVCEINTYIKNILKKSQYFKTLTEHSLEFFGTCKKCDTK